MFCAALAGQAGRRVVLLDNGKKPGRKILMSGGGRCNFTNLHVEPAAFLSQNPHFCKSALSRYTQWDFIALMQRHGIAYHEKTLGQLFCDESAQQVVNLLLKECQQGQVTLRLRCDVGAVERQGDDFILTLTGGAIKTPALVIATGGLSMPGLGATPFGYKIAEQFGLPVLPTRAALVPVTLHKPLLEQLSVLSGIGVPALVSTEKGVTFRENLLFTHRGLSGPAILQISSFWESGDTVEINLMPDHDVPNWLAQQQAERPNSELKTLLGEIFTKKMANLLADNWFVSKPMKQYTHAEIADIAQKLSSWQLVPAGTEGYRTAEVTLGGVDTREVSSKTMESLKSPGLYFIGEVLDVTGHLGGFNFQWAWASGYAAAQYA